MNFISLQLLESSGGEHRTRSGPAEISEVVVVVVVVVSADALAMRDGYDR